MLISEPKREMRSDTVAPGTVAQKSTREEETCGAEIHLAMLAAQGR